jgi:hypothetical protein
VVAMVVTAVVIVVVVVVVRQVVIVKNFVKDVSPTWQVKQLRYRSFEVGLHFDL